MKRSPIKRKAPLFRKKKLNKMSAKQTQRNIKYYRIRDAWMKDHPWCEICKTRGQSQWKIATDLHHKKGRNGDLLFDTRYFAALCRYHHDKVHNNPAWAKEKGWLIPWWKVNEPDPEVSDRP